MFWIVVQILVVMIFTGLICWLWSEVQRKHHDYIKVVSMLQEYRKESAEYAAIIDERDNDNRALLAENNALREENGELNARVSELTYQLELREYKLSRKPNKKKPQK